MDPAVGVAALVTVEVEVIFFLIFENNFFLFNIFKIFFCENFLNFSKIKNDLLFTNIFLIFEIFSRGFW